MFSKILKSLPALALGASLALTPATALAQGQRERGGGQSAVRGAQRGGGGHEYRGGERREGDRDRYRGGRYYYGGPGYSFGFYSDPYFYGYGPGQYYGPAACGYYDQFGNWIATPGCYPYGY